MITALVSGGSASEATRAPVVNLNGKRPSLEKVFCSSASPALK